MSSNITEYSVSELSFALKRTVEDAYGLVRVRGELSGVKRAASGHMYLALKDDKSVLDGVCWRGTAKRFAFAPEDGLEVVATGKLTTFPGRSKYQIVIEHMEPAGAGALMALFEERKQKLAAEGLFDASRKKPLPFLPEVIGIVTSPTGAVIRDILHRLRERFPRHVLLRPVIVQGEGAAEQIAQAIRDFESILPRPDVLIVARGGGSIEDLWAFNEEIVARAVVASTIPLVSAVGHETDTTLIDFVADQRAPTPTAAAEIAVPVRGELRTTLQALGERQIHGLDRQLGHWRQKIDGLARGLPDPRMLLTLGSQRFDDLSERLRLRSPMQILDDRAERVAQRHARLAELAKDRLEAAGERARTLGKRLSAEPIVAKIDVYAPMAGTLASRLETAVQASIERASARLDAGAKLLESMSHNRVLERGYALVHRTADDGLLRSKQEAEREPALTIEFHDGRIDVARPGAPKRSARKSPPVEQETLL